jgi:serine/threonine-protein kinase
VYGPEVRRCPRDGTSLAVTGSAIGGGVGETQAVSRDLRSSAERAPQVDLTPQPLTGLAPGTKVGEYQVSAQIGEGGMGTVYAGVHPVIGKKVAIKVLNAGLSQDLGVVQRFIQEARAVNQIGHRNIVDIFAFGQLPDGRHYFVMEFLSGRSLYARLGQQPPMAYDEAFSVLLDVCSALAAAHGEGIVHRDLKPDNIFITEAKTGEKMVKLLDFGIAKLLKQEEGLQRTRTGIAMGTPLYMAPEQCLGKGVDARTDVYALGVIMFEIFTGQLPFPGPSYIETVNGHLSKPPPEPREFVDIPDSLRALILSCMQKEPERRPQQVLDVRQRLIEIARELGTDVGRRTGAHPVMPPAMTPRRKTPSASGPLSVGAPAVGVTAPPIEPAVTSRRKPLVYVAVAAGVIAVGVAVAIVAGPKKSGPPPTEVPKPAAEVSLQILTTPAGATVTIDGEKQPLRSPYTFKIAARAKVKVRLEKDGYKPFEQLVSYGEKDVAQSIDAQLVPLKVAGAQLKVRTNVKKADWMLDGKAVGAGAGVLALDDVPPGPHTLAVSAKGYAPREEKIELRSAQYSELQWTLDHEAVPRGKKSSSGSTSKPPEDVNSTSGWPPK